MMGWTPAGDEAAAPAKPAGAALLWLELAALFMGLPVALALYGGPRWLTHVCLWFSAAYALVWLSHRPDFSWRRLWHGEGWPDALRRRAIRRFLVLAPFLAGLTFYLAPDRFLLFPLSRPGVWVLVMLLYPPLSVVPQELVFRSFFFARYRALLPRPALLAFNALLFGFSHIMFLNMIAPALCAIGGSMFALNYMEHRSLKWAAAEHAAYGCLIFTLGLGWYFFARGAPP
jgi:hypothetical protein